MHSQFSGSFSLFWRFVPLLFYIDRYRHSSLRKYYWAQWSLLCWREDSSWKDQSSKCQPIPYASVEFQNEFKHIEMVFVPLNWMWLFSADDTFKFARTTNDHKFISRLFRKIFVSYRILQQWRFLNKQMKVEWSSAGSSFLYWYYNVQFSRSYII